MRDFVHLHLHSEYSLLDGTCKTESIPEKVKSLGQRAVAITDHGNMFGAVGFYKACKKNNIKPIIGCEVYVSPCSRFDKTRVNGVPFYHLVLLVKNEIGYKNLCYMVSKSYTEGFYYKPRVDTELIKEHSEGLICLSSCLSGLIPKSIILGDFRGAEEYAAQLKDIFGSDFYLELQYHGLDEQDKVNKSLIFLSKKLNIQLVCTNDVHYIDKKDSIIQSILLSVRNSDDFSDKSCQSSEFYIKSAEDMESIFADIPEALDNTVRIADKCNFDFNFGNIIVPKYPLVDGENAKNKLYTLAKAGFERRINNKEIIFQGRYKSEDYTDRMNYELSVIDEMGYNDYFLIVWDFINYAIEKNIPVGPGRGSGAGSLVAYLLNITDVDPIKYGLLFERFLNKERVSMPDIDTDFCYERRDEVIEYVKKRYGDNHVSQIVTFGTMAAKASIRDVGRVLKTENGKVDKVCNLITKKVNSTIEESLSENKQLKYLYDSDTEVKKMIDMAKIIEGLPRHSSTHAAGVVITDKPLYDYLPLSTNGDVIVTQYNMDDIASLGLLKFDFLALRYLTIIDNAVKEIQKRNTGFSLNIIDLNDKKTYSLLSKGETEGVFQLESEGIKKVLRDLNPNCIEDIIACISLYRPGPMDTIPKYIESRKNKDKIKYSVPALEPILNSTYGCIIYQEQVMQIFREVGGYSYGKADIVRRAMAKKKTKEIEKERFLFIDGAQKNGVDLKTAEDLFTEMANFAKYAFNKSHATAYSVISFRTAYLKANYTKEYICSLLSSVIGNYDKTNDYIKESEKFNIRILPPNINKSIAYFSVEDNSIRYGLLGIKNIGLNFISAIVEERDKNGIYTDFYSFLYRLKDSDINKRQIESMIMSGAFDCFGTFRSRLLSKYEEMIDSFNDISKKASNGQLDFSSALSNEDRMSVLPSFNYPDIPELSKKDIILSENNVLGFSFSGHILDSYKKQINSLKSEKIADILKKENDSYINICGLITKCSVVKTRKGEDMCFLVIDDGTASVNVTVFPSYYRQNRELFVIYGCLNITGKYNRENDASVILQTAKILNENSFSEKTKQAIQKRLYLKVTSIDSPVTDEIIDMTKDLNGDTEIIFYEESTKKYKKLDGTKITVTQEVLSILKEVLGDSSVIYKD